MRTLLFSLLVCLACLASCTPQSSFYLADTPEDIRSRSPGYCEVINIVIDNRDGPQDSIFIDPFLIRLPEKSRHTISIPPGQYVVEYHSAINQIEFSGCLEYRAKTDQYQPSNTLFMLEPG